MFSTTNTQVILTGELKISDLFQTFPPEAINRSLFSKQEIKINDVVSVLKVKYDYSESTLVETQKEVFSLMGGTPSGVLFDVLQEQAARDDDFLRQFVFFSTGSSFIPKKSNDFKVIVEFNCFEMVEDSLPMAHTCDLTIKFPGTAYNGDKEVLTQKLLSALESGKGFQMA